jgi:hypothetical protein
MLRKFTVCLPIEIFEDLREEAAKHRLSISDVVREKILGSRSAILEVETPVAVPLKNESPQNQNSSTVVQSEEASKQISEISLRTLKTLLLLREFLFERNAQILKKVDEKMARHFGEEGKKVP